MKYTDQGSPSGHAIRQAHLTTTDVRVCVWVRVCVGTCVCVLFLHRVAANMIYLCWFYCKTKLDIMNPLCMSRLGLAFRSALRRAPHAVKQGEQRLWMSLAQLC